MDAKRLGAAIKERRLQLDMSQEDLAKRANIAASYISKLERGLRPRPGLNALRSIAIALGYASVDDLTSLAPAVRGVSGEAIAMSTGPGANLTEKDLDAIERVVEAAVERALRRRGLDPSTGEPLGNG